MQGGADRPGRNHSLVLVLLTGMLVGLCVVLAYPFLSGITWGVAFAIIAWPVHRRLRNVVWPSVSAVICSLLLVVLLLVPAVLVTMQLAREASNAATTLADAAQEGVVREKLAEVPGVGSALEYLQRVNIDAETELRNLAGKSVRDLTGLAQGSIGAILQFLVAIFILFYILHDHDVMKEGVRELLPLTRMECDQVFRRAGDAVHASIYSTIVISALDGLGGGLVFWAVGMPSPVLWGVVMFVLAVLPVVGSGLVWAPAAFYLAATGQWLSCTVVVIWGLATFVFIDNILHARLAGARMRMHDVPALIAILGGLAVFGLSGMILGPAIVAVTMAILEVWKRRMIVVDDGAINGHAAEPTGLELASRKVQVADLSEAQVLTASDAVTIP